jgi:hypothetical protein
LTAVAVSGGLLIILAFVLLAWSTYEEMGEEKRKRYSMGQVSESDAENEEESSSF